MSGTGKEQLQGRAEKRLLDYQERDYEEEHGGSL
jgi:hypothetical protein